MSSGGGELQKQMASSVLSSGNMGYIDALYEDYLVDANSVSQAWRDFFNSLPKTDGQKEIGHRDILAHFLAIGEGNIQATGPVVAQASRQSAMDALINAYRSKGHLAAQLDPLKLTPSEDIVELHATTHGFLDAELGQLKLAAPSFGSNAMSAAEIIQALKETYCTHIGFEFMHITDSKQVAWFIENIEPIRGKYQFKPEMQREIFQNLVAADGLERYLGTRFVGQKRFSLEGGDALIPMMQSLKNQAGAANVREMVIGMAHRGRLNMLVNVLGKSPKSLFEEFEGKVHSLGTGDVKYHMGYSADLKTNQNQIVHVTLGFNPSHLEIIGPVVEGSVRARLHRQHNVEEKNKVLPVLIHGDAAFAGQGVIMEMLNFSQVRGFSTGGTIHLVINNQIGFTTSNPCDARSTRYCTDIAKFIEAPIIHVNGEDAEATVYAMQLAFAYRQTFKRDVVIDLVCYRRHGHNEADEPAMTQPEMYKRIKTMLPLRETYGQRLVELGVIKQDELTNAYEIYRTKLDAGENLVEVMKDNYPGKVTNDWSPYIDTKWTATADTRLDRKVLEHLEHTLQQLPKDFTLHPVVARLMNERAKMTIGELPINWGYAEILAYASLLNEGFGIRLTGQDVGRGTFAHRHTVLHDMKTAECYIPLKQLVKNKAKGCEIIDSLLSEEAVLAFEYGYACSEPTTLVLWEAQFGDFANGAQVVIDQFISSGEQKWGRLCGLVMLLPHGYEGQGPEHSSARLERYMQLCAQHNIQVCVPTTPAQIFHLLRRQMLRPFRKPLIVMTPKSLLRHKLAVSSLSELIDGEFQPLIGEIDKVNANDITRLIVCSGKVYYDLLQKRREEDLKHIAIIRVEQLYPFPETLFVKILKTYPKLKDVIWCQEEPENQGAWFASAHHICACLGASQKLTYAGRAFAASPAVGSPILHAEQQADLVAQALGIKKEGKS